MKHVLKLNQVPFDKIKSGAKIIESRLFDDKRRTIQLGDILEFHKQPDLTETIQTKVVGLLHYQTFADLMNDLPAHYFGWETSQKTIDAIYKIYSKDQEREYGVLGIRISLL